MLDKKFTIEWKKKKKINRTCIDLFILYGKKKIYLKCMT